MTDRITKQQRSDNMAKIKSKNTLLELGVRSLLFKKGYRFRLYHNLPGKPDITLPSRKVVILVHGCFWHQHNCKKAALPTTNTNFWKIKLMGNKKRDRENLQKLKGMGWTPYILWECKINTPEKLRSAVDHIDKKIRNIRQEYKGH